MRRKTLTALGLILGFLLLQDGAKAQSSFPPTSGGVAVSDNNTWTGTQTFGDEAFLVCDDGDGTKCLEFEASGISAATTRTLTIANSSGTLAFINVAQSWSGGQTFAGNVVFGGANIHTAQDNTTPANGLHFGSSQDTYLGYLTDFTPDAAAFGTSTDSNSLHLIEKADDFDFNNCSAGTSAQTNPTFCVHSSDQATNEWAEINVDTAGGGSFKSAQELILQSAQIGTAGGKALTESSATAVFELSVAQGAHTGGVVNWTVVADDSTDFQALTGVTQFQAVNKAGTETCTVSTAGGTDEAASTGTLTNTVTCTVGLTDVVQIAFNAASSLTQTTLVAYYTVNLNGPGTVIAQ